LFPNQWHKKEFFKKKLMQNVSTFLDYYFRKYSHSKLGLKSGFEIRFFFLEKMLEITKTLTAGTHPNQTRSGTLSFLLLPRVAEVLAALQRALPAPG
jgi:hypothetical protein